MSTPYQPPLALRWNRLVCDAIYYAKLPPTLSARALAIVHTAMYDAWTAYRKGKEVSTTTGARLKKQESECTQKNREIAFSYAAYRTIDSLFFSYLSDEQKKNVDQLMGEIGCSVNDNSFDISTPQGIGNLCAKLVLDCRKGDGSNHEDEYRDFTGYKPQNDAPPKRPLKNPEKWQPQLDANKKLQKFLTPHWGLVKPFALTFGGQFRPPSPAPCGSERFDRQIENIIQISECLTDKQKLIAEYWAGMHEDKFDNPTSIPGYGHWTVPPAQSCRIANFIAVKKELKNAGVIKLYFALSNALLDASISCWDAKVVYDYGRPESIIHELFDNKNFDAWGGPCEGIVSMQGENWCPYLITTPPFAEYVSGHSTFSSATVEVISCLCGSNEYGESIVFPVKSSVIEPECTPAKEIKLTWNTLQEAADQAGWSRRLGGIHFEDSDLEGRKLGKKVADCVLDKAISYFNGELG